MIDKRLLEFCINDRQTEVLDAYIRHGSSRKAAIELDCHHSNVIRIHETIKRQAAERGYDPDYGLNNPVSKSMSLSGTSTLLDKDGNIKLQWVKGKSKNETSEEDVIKSLQNAIENIDTEFKPKPLPQHDTSDLLTVYPIADSHFGVMSISGVGGEGYNLEQAFNIHKSAFDRLCETAPNTEECLIINLGDMLHTDNTSNQTMNSGNILDVSCRWEDALEAAYDYMLWTIERARDKHPTVRVRIEPGNHDYHSATALALFLKKHYQDCTQVIVERKDNRKFWYYRFGKVLIGTTHGDKIKMNDLESIMAHDAADLWSKTLHRYWLTGHLHHTKMQEYRNCIVEVFRSLVDRDKYHDDAGYRSGREMQRIIYHREHGEYERQKINIGMING